MAEHTPPETPKDLGLTPPQAPSLFYSERRLIRRALRERYGASLPAPLSRLRESAAEAYHQASVGVRLLGRAALRPVHGFLAGRLEKSREAELDASFVRREHLLQALTARAKISAHENTRQD